MYFYYYYHQNGVQPKLARRVCVCLAQSFEPTCPLQITSDGLEAKLRNSFLANNSRYKHNGVERKVKKYQWNVFVWRFPLCNKILWALRLPRSFLIIYDSTFVTLRCWKCYRNEVTLPLLDISFIRRKLNIKCMFAISGLVLSSWYVCQKKLSINPIFGHLHICFFGTVHQKYHVPQRISPKGEIHISLPPKPIPISHLPSRGKRPMFHGLNSAASEPFNKLSQICQNWVSPPTSDNHPPKQGVHI